RLGPQFAVCVAVVGLHIAEARRLQHLAGGLAGVGAHGELVLAPGAVYADLRKPERIGIFGQLDVVLVARQAFAEGRHAEAPRPGIAQRVFEVGPEPGLREAPRPVAPAGTTLKAVAAHEVVAARGGVAQVAVARDVERVRAV